MSASISSPPRPATSAATQSPAQPLRILYVIMAFGTRFIANEVHAELGRVFQAEGHSFEVLTPAAGERGEGDSPQRHRDTEGGKGEDYIGGNEEGKRGREGDGAGIVVHVLGFMGRGGLVRRAARWVSGRVFHYEFFLELLLAYARFMWRHRRDYDVLHVEAAYPLGAIAALVSLAVRVPLVLNLQGTDVAAMPDYDFGYARYPLARRLLRFALGCARLVRANSHVTAALARDLGTPDAKIRTVLRNIAWGIYPPPDTDIAAYKAACRADVLQRHDLTALLGDDGPFILAMGRVMEIKGFDLLVKALPAVLHDHPNAVLMIAGPSRSVPRIGDYGAYLARLAAEMGPEVARRVILPGTVDFSISRRYLAAADVVVIPSLFDALNKVALEAAAVGTPCLLSDATGAAPQMAEAGAGIEFAAGSVAALETALLDALRDPAQLRAMGANGPAFARQFTARAIGDQMLALYAEAVAPKTRRARIAYVAYPSSLTLKSANALQTWYTLRELRRLRPGTIALLPRLPRRASRFTEVGATHLPRIPFNALANVPGLKSALWSYLERSVFSAEAGAVLLWRRIRGRGPDVVYVRDVIAAFWLVTLWRRLLRVKVIYEVHDLEARNPSRARRVSGMLQRLDRVVIGRADGIVSLTGAFLDYMAESGLRPRTEADSAVIADAVEASIFVPGSQPEARQRLDIPADAFAVVYSGLTFAYRRLDLLLDAFARFVAAQPEIDARLYFVGGRDKERAELAAQIARLGAAARARVVLVGQTDPATVNLYLNAASLLTIPDTVTDITASPLKLFEYAAVARPIVLPDLPALREILDDDAAYYFERGNAASLGAVLTHVAASPAEAAAHGAQARARVEADYTYTRRAARIAAFADKIAFRPHP